MNDDDKIEICKSAAKAIFARSKQAGYPFDALVNEGFVRIKTDDPKLAYTIARMYMLQLINRGGIGKRVEATRKTLDRTDGRSYMSVSMDKREPRVTNGITLDELIDVRDAIDSLSPDEQLLLSERFIEDMTFEQIARLYDKKHGNSIKFQIDKILTKLKVFLSK